MKIFKEPLFHFLIIGIGIFIINGFFSQGQSSDNEIIITLDDIQRLKTLYAQNWNKEPDQQTLDKLIDQYVESEIYYKEALKLNLDHNDEIIKRRLKQKYQFLAQDLADFNHPTEENLLNFYQKNNDQYRSERSMSFYQYYISPDNYNDPYSMAVQLYNRLKETTPEDVNNLGDNIHLDRHQNQQNESEIRRNFGSDFTELLLDLDQTGWHQPIRSGLGYHVIYIEEINPSEELDFSFVKNKVEEDWKTANRESFAEMLIEGLRKDYKIVIQDAQ